jgi:hypothetical protein
MSENGQGFFGFFSISSLKIFLNISRCPYLDARCKKVFPSSHS